MLLASLLVGVSLIVLSTRPRSVAVAMPDLVQVCWEVGLVLAGVVGLTGVFWPGRLTTGLGTELVAMCILGTATTMYGVALFAVTGLPALAAGSFVAAVAVASWWRVGQILHDGLRIARAAEHGKLAEIPLLVEKQR